MRAYPSCALARTGAAELEAEADGLFGKRQESGPRAPVMATLPLDAAAEPDFAESLVAVGIAARGSIAPTMILKFGGE